MERKYFSDLTKLYKRTIFRSEQTKFFQAVSLPNGCQFNTVHGHICVVVVSVLCNIKPKVVNAVTLAVTPNDAQMLDLARSVGTLSLVLRNQTDPATIATPGGATKAELLGWTKRMPERVSAPAPRAVAAPRAPVAVAMPVAVPVPLPVVIPVAVAAPPPIKSVDCVEIIRGSSKVTECF